MAKISYNKNIDAVCIKMETNENLKPISQIIDYDYLLIWHLKCEYMYLKWVYNYVHSVIIRSIFYF